MVRQPDLAPLMQMLYQMFRGSSTVSQFQLNSAANDMARFSGERRKAYFEALPGDWRSGLVRSNIKP